MVYLTRTGHLASKKQVRRTVNHTVVLTATTETIISYRFVRHVTICGVVSGLYSVLYSAKRHTTLLNSRVGVFFVGLSLDYHFQTITMVKLQKPLVGCGETTVVFVSTGFYSTVYVFGGTCPVTIHTVLRV